MPEHSLHMLHYFLYVLGRLKVTGSMVPLEKMMGKRKKSVMGIARPVNTLDVTDTLSTELQVPSHLELSREVS